jgi:PAS domain S-box-containing protein
MKFYYEKFKQLRKQNRISANYIALKIGKSRSAVTAWENGIRNPKEFYIRMLANILNTSVEEISDLKQTTFKESKTDFKIPEFSESILKFAKYDAVELKKQHKEAFRQIADVNAKIFQELNLNSIIVDALMTALPQSIYIKDINLRYIMTNTGFLENAGLDSRFNVIGHNDTKFFSTKESRYNTREDEKVISTGIEVIQRKGYMPGSRKKKIAYISKIPVKDSGNNIVGLIGLFNDITLQEKHRIKSELLNLVIHENLKDGIWLSLDDSDNFIYINKAVEKILGYTLEEINAEKDLWLNIVHPDYKEAVYKAVMEFNPEGNSIQYIITAKDGRKKKIQLNLSWGEIEGKMYNIGTVQEIKGNN